MYNIEVEIQSFITKEKYEELLKFFRKNAKIVREEFQETFYFDEKSNLRIQRNDTEAKLWHKSGDVHDEIREEIEIPVKREDFEKLEKFLGKLGHRVKIKWFRTRNQFDWNGIKVCLDHTKGYGYIVEFEIMSSEEEQEDNLKKIKDKFENLNLEITPKDEFKKKYEYYKENWRELTK